jgi:hypothetical protein
MPVDDDGDQLPVDDDGDQLPEDGVQTPTLSVIVGRELFALS